VIPIHRVTVFGVAVGIGVGVAVGFGVFVGVGIGVGVAVGASVGVCVAGCASVGSSVCMDSISRFGASFPALALPTSSLSSGLLVASLVASIVVSSDAGIASSARAAAGALFAGKTATDAIKSPIASSAVSPFFNCIFSMKTGLISTAQAKSNTQLSALSERSANAIRQSTTEKIQKTIVSAFFTGKPSSHARV